MAKTKLLVPMDGSPAALKALKWAARDGQADLLVLNVQPALPKSRFITEDMIAEFQARNTAAAIGPARALLKRLKVDARMFTAIGEPAATIVDFANKHRCAAIVMGNRGQRPVTGLLLGSVTTKVIHLAKCPVTIVK